MKEYCIQTSRDFLLKLACVQTSPLPQKKSGEGGGTSVHRLVEANSFAIFLSGN